MGSFAAVELPSSREQGRGPEEESPAKPVTFPRALLPTLANGMALDTTQQITHMILCLNKCCSDTNVIINYNIRHSQEPSMLSWSSIIYNPRRACAARVTRVCVCVCVCVRWPRSTFAFPVSRFYIRPHLCLAFPVRPHLCFAFPISHSALICASRFPFVLICASRFPFLIPPSFVPRVSRSSSFVLRVSHFSFRPHLCLAFPVRPHLCFAFPISQSALIRAPNFSPPGGATLNL